MTGATLGKVIHGHVDAADSTLHTDEAAHYKGLGKQVRGPRGRQPLPWEYVRGNVSTNQVEGFFSQLKRSVDGTHHLVSAENLPRYLAEFDFRHTTRDLTDTNRMVRVVEQVAGRRLFYDPAR